MAINNAYSTLTLIELAKRKGPDGDLLAIAEVLAEDNEVLQDAIFMEANDTFSHKGTRRVSLPSGSWRKLNSGVANEASRTVPYVETIGMLETYSEVDKDLVVSAPNPRQFRMDEARAFLEGLSQTWASTFFYANTTTTPEKFQGIATRLSSLNADANVIGAGGTGSDCTSVYIVQWNPSRVFCVYPRNDPFNGVRHTDLGEHTLQDGDGNNYQGYRDHFQWKSGLVVNDDRCIARIANIESTGTSNIFDEDDLIKILNRMPMRGKGASIYANEEVISQMEIRLKDKTNVYFQPNRGEGLAGEPVMYFRGNPIRLCEQILITEDAIT